MSGASLGGLRSASLLTGGMLGGAGSLVTGGLSLAPVPNPGDYYVEIQRSLGGFLDIDFSPLGTVADLSPGDAFTLPDSPVVPGQLYLYRARLVLMEDHSVHGDWAYVFARGPYPAGAATMGNVITAASTLAGIGVEATAGVPVQTTYGLEVVSHNVAAAIKRAKATANRNTYSSTTAETAAASSVGGPLTVYARTGAALLRLLLAGYHIASVTDVAAVTGPPAVGANHIFKLVPGQAQFPLTFISKEDVQAFVSTGCTLGSISVDADKNSTSVQEIAFEIMALNQGILDASSGGALTAIGLDILGYDVTPNLGPVDWILKYGGVTFDADQFKFSNNRNVKEEQVGNNKMGPISLYPDRHTLSVSARKFFKDLAAFKAYWGHASGDVLPLGIKRVINTSEVRWTVTPPNNSNGWSNVHDLVFPVCSIESLVKQVPNSGALMQELTFTPLDDAANGYIDHYWLITHSEAQSSVLTAGTAISGGMPANDMA